MSSRDLSVAEIKVGTRVEVYWSGDDEYYKGTVCEKSRSKKGNKIFVEYDDGDDEWLDMHSPKITITHKDNSHMINDKRTLKYMDRMQIGSRISIFWPNRDEFFPATLMKFKEDAKYPHYMKYDDGAREWSNLFLRRCKLITDLKPDSSVALSSSDVQSDKSDSALPPKKRKYTGESEEIRSVKVARQASQQTCGICEITIAKKPRAISCYHIFCKDCIASHCRKGSKECPLCKNPISSVYKPDESHCSFNPIEALQKESGELSHSYISASAASIALNLDPIRIIDACQSRNLDDSEYAGHFWRFQTADKSLSSDTIPTEHIDANRGTVDSLSSRKKSTNSDGGHTMHDLEDDQKLSSTSDSSHVKNVEMLDYQTGDVLRSFNSLEDADDYCKSKTQYREGNIRDVCEGRAQIAFGLFWRWKDSHTLPQHMVGVRKVPQIRKALNEKVSIEFHSVEDANDFFDSNVSWLCISQWCREETFNLGYHWTYRYTMNPKGFIECCISERIRILHEPDNKWKEGNIVLYDKKSKKFKMSFHGGKTEYHRLEDIKYEWKRNEWQKPIELIDRETRDVLTTFKTVTDACFALSISDPASITNILEGKQRTFLGFMWRYREQNDTSYSNEKRVRESMNLKSVEQVCVESGRVLATYNSVSDAGKVLNVSTAGISYCCNKRQGHKSASGFVWRYIDDEEETFRGF